MKCEFVVVPVKPTERMLNAAFHAIDAEGIKTTRWMRETIYKAMIKVAAEDSTANAGINGAKRPS